MQYNWLRREFTEFSAKYREWEVFESRAKIRTVQRHESHPVSFRPSYSHPGAPLSFQRSGAATERKPIATPLIPLLLPRLSPPPWYHVTRSVLLSRSPSPSSAVLPRLVSRGCRPSPFPSNETSPAFSLSWNARPSRRRVLLRRPEHHSVAKSARAFLPARTGITYPESHYSGAS